jgi:hypothetical protein
MTGADPGLSYFIDGFGIASLPQDVWCISIGLIYGKNHPSTTNSTFGGIYRLDTGVRLSTSTSYKMKNGATTQMHRAYLYYSTPDTNGVVLQFWNPQFYEINGNETSLTNMFNTIKTNASGNVGIGTTAPSAKLHIVQTGSEDAFRVDDEANDQTLLRIDSAGNVGIGVSLGTIPFPEPVSKLHILDNPVPTGTQLTSFSGPSDVSVFIRKKHTDTPNINTYGGSLFFGDNLGNNFLASGIAGVQTTTDDDQYGLAFFCHAGTGSGNVVQETMRIMHDGNVGIGTTAPSAKLHIVQSGTGIGDSFRVDDVLDDSTPFIIKEDGNVGIGTTTPTTTLDVNGEIKTNSIRQNIVVINNSNYTISANDPNYILTGTTLLSAARTFTLPSASLCTGKSFIIKDQGAINGGNVLNISRSGSDTIQGSTSVSITAAWGLRELLSTGSRWVYLNIIN